MAREKLAALIVDALENKARAKTYREFAKWEAIYTALKTQWNKRTGNALIEKEALS